MNFVTYILSNTGHLGSHSVLGSVTVNPVFPIKDTCPVSCTLTHCCPYLGPRTSTHTLASTWPGVLATHPLEDRYMQLVSLGKEKKVQSHKAPCSFHVFRFAGLALTWLFPPSNFLSVGYLLQVSREGQFRSWPYRFVTMCQVERTLTFLWLTSLYTVINNYV